MKVMLPSQYRRKKLQERYRKGVVMVAEVPSLRALTKALRILNYHYDGPGLVGFSRSGELESEGYFNGNELIGCVELPGDNRSFDAVATARRLLAAWRDR